MGRDIDQRAIRRTGWRALSALLFVLSLLGALSTEADAATTPSGPRSSPTLLAFSEQERSLIAAMGPWPSPSVPDVSNRVEQQARAVALGRRLFFDPQLSADGQRSCATCHRPDRAFQDGLPVAQGRAAGVRNTQGLLDAAQLRWLGWDGAHDSLWSASLAPLLAAGEMGHSTASLAIAVRGRPDVSRAYQQVFGTLPREADDVLLSVNLAKALAAYQATLHSPRTPFDAFRDALLRGDAAAAARYPLPAQRGLRLFMGEARCSVCHSGPSFSNGEFADIGRPFFVAGGVDAGRHAGLQKLLGSPMNRLGSHNDAGAAVDPRAVLTQHLTQEHRHFGEFRVPSLRQLVHTAPYMHDGSLPTLEAVVRHYDVLNEERLHADGERILRPLNLSAQQTADLAAFLRSLSSPPAALPR